MQVLIDLISNAFSILTQNSVFNIPILVWLLIPCLFIILMNFLKGKKE